jgi:hypothetical protein
LVTADLASASVDQRSSSSAIKETLQYSVAMFKKKATTFRNAFSTGRRRRAAFAAESVVFATLRHLASYIVSGA